MAYVIPPFYHGGFPFKQQSNLRSKLDQLPNPIDIDIMATILEHKGLVDNTPNFSFSQAPSSASSGTRQHAFYPYVP